MTNQERAEKAYELKASGQCNCAQAVLKVFEDKLPVDSEALMSLASGFAAGMGCMESTCGALVGAVMAGGQMLQGKGRILPFFLVVFKELFLGFVDLILSLFPILVIAAFHYLFTSFGYTGFICHFLQLFVHDQDQY